MYPQKNCPRTTQLFSLHADGVSIPCFCASASGSAHIRIMRGFCICLTHSVTFFRSILVRKQNAFLRLGRRILDRMVFQFRILSFARKVL